MTVPLLATGLDPGIGMFHADVDRRLSLALDAIEAVRPHVDYWLLTYLASSGFANRDFTELPDAEVRVSHPLSSHLAHTAALWRKVCEPVANWLSQSFWSAVGVAAVLMDDRKTLVQQAIPLKQSEQQRGFTPLPAFSGPARGRWPIPLQRGRRHEPVPPTCWECGKALVGRRRAFVRTTALEPSLSISYSAGLGSSRPFRRREPGITVKPTSCRVGRCRTCHDRR
jgi:hypothetical protein